MTKGYLIIGWPEIREQMPRHMRTYWTFQDDIAMINGIIMKGRCVVIPLVLKTHELDQLHVNYMGMENTKLLGCESVYWGNINDDIERHIKIAPHTLHFSRHN